MAARAATVDTPSSSGGSRNLLLFCLSPSPKYSGSATQITEHIPVFCHEILLQMRLAYKGKRAQVPQGEDLGRILQESFPFLHILQEETLGPLCSRPFFQWCLYNAQPWNLTYYLPPEQRINLLMRKITSFSRERAGLLTAHDKRLRYPEVRVPHL